MIKIGLFTDAHAANMELACRTRRPVLSQGKIREAMEAFAACDAVICLGDLVDDCRDAQLNEQWLRDIAQTVSRTGLPFYALLGNHDCVNFTKEDFYRISGFAPLPLYTRMGDVTLVFLDGCFFSDGTPYTPARVDWTDTMVSREQVEGLRALLQQEDTKRVYLFVHQCLDPSVEHRHIIQNADEIRRILAESGKVEAVYQGHYHKGYESLIDGIPYHTLPAMVEGEENRFWILNIEE